MNNGVPAALGPVPAVPDLRWLPTAIVHLLAGIALASSGLRNASGEERAANRATRQVIGLICDDRDMSDSAVVVHRQAMALPVDERYAFLSQWVLPSADHDTLRLHLDFTPTQPAPGAPAELEQLDARKSSTAVPELTGGQLVAPALDLVVTAKALGRLAEVRTKLERDERSGELPQRCRLALLGLVELAAGADDRAAAHFDRLFARIETRSFDEFSARWPETLAIHVSLQHPRTRAAAADALYRMLQAQVRSGVARGPDSWDRWVTGTASRLTGLASYGDGATPIPALPVPALHDSWWQPVSRLTAWSRGRGLASAAWERGPGIVANVASHTQDYLFFRVPLRGDFEVECDVTGFNYRDSHLLVAGTYVAPIYDHASYGIGTFREDRPMGTIMPRLSHCGEWIHYRAVVRNQACQTFVNGRLVHTEPLSPEHDPWVAIRSRSDTDGAVRDLRITGKPVVPEQVRLSASNELTGWYCYYDHAVGSDNATWQQLGDVAGGGGIVGRREPWLQGQGCEHLLAYQRPMLEDGTIEYEFFCQPGESMVHPALDRRAWILDPQGVSVHWVTDGRFERNGLDPLNRTEATNPRREPPTLPLRPGAWNRLRLDLRGTKVSLWLNDALVYRDELEPTNLRTFGLFYWSDQVEARVRNVVWRGAWPRELPALEAQELVRHGSRWLDDRLPQLPAKWEHDFQRDGTLPVALPMNSKTRPLVEPTPDGVRMAVRSGRGYTPAWLGPNLQMVGDFDVRAEFEQLRWEGNQNSSTGTYLMIVFGDPEVTHAGIYRGRIAKPNQADRIVVQSEFNRKKPTGIVMDWPGSTAEESTSGTFRLARRGDTIYCLFAEGDSAHFRLIHQEPIPLAATRFDGLRLMTSISNELASECLSSVVWKRLSVRAEKLVDRTAVGQPMTTPPAGTKVER